MNFGSPYSSPYRSPSASKEKIYDNQEVKKYPKDFPVTKLPTPIYDEQDNPVYILTSGNFLYRGSEKRGLPLEDLIGIQWYALDLPNVFQYGYPSKYRLNRDLNLLAIDKINKTHPFFIGLDEDEEMKTKFNKFIRYDDEGNKQRVSIADNDYDVCKYICSLGYDGYAMNKMKDDSGGEFHAEVGLNNGHEKLILIEHINVDNITDENGEKLIGKDDEPITNAWIEDSVLRKKQRAEGLKNRNKSSKRSYNSSLNINPMIMDEDDEPFRIQSKPTIFNFESPPNFESSPKFESPPKRQNTGPISPHPFSYSSPYSPTINSPYSPTIKTGGKTKKRNRKTKKNKKKQTKKKNKKSKRKSNKK